MSQVPWWVLLVDGRYKYIRTLVEGELEELYDLQSDPQELDNLAVKPEWSDKLSGLRQATIEELRRTKAGFVDNLPGIKDLSKQR